MHTTITVSSPIIEGPRVALVRGLFDLPAERTSHLTWTVTLPIEARPWAIGLITGPSGCGKSTIARNLWPAETASAAGLSWPAEHCLLDAFPEEVSVKEVTALLSAVGFS